MHTFTNSVRYYKQKEVSLIFLFSLNINVAIKCINLVNKRFISLSIHLCIQNILQFQKFLELCTLFCRISKWSYKCICRIFPRPWKTNCFAILKSSFQKCKKKEDSIICNLDLYLFQKTLTTPTRFARTLVQNKIDDFQTAAPECAVSSARSPNCALLWVC